MKLLFTEAGCNSGMTLANGGMEKRSIEQETLSSNVEAVA